jgi:hypothetical protein
MVRVEFLLAILQSIDRDVTEKAERLLRRQASICDIT